MCQQCWSGDHGAPIVNTEEVLVTAELIRRLYEDLGCPTGGPLHWMLDDMNIDDEQVENADLDKICEYLFDGSFERWAQAGEDTSDERKNAIKETCGLILHSFSYKLPESHRAAAIAWHEGWIPRRIEFLTGRPGEMKANAAQVDSLVAEWTEAMNGPPSRSDGTKECVSVPCPPFTGTLTWDPGAGLDPGVKVVGPDVVQVDSRTNVTWGRELVSRFISVEPYADSISVAWGHPTEIGPDVPPRLHFPNARCPIEPPHVVHTWGDPPYWCDAQPLPDTDRIEPS
jgi:hypothetical protein